MPPEVTEAEFALRERVLGEGCFAEKRPRHPVGRAETNHPNSVAAHPTFRRRAARSG